VELVVLEMEERCETCLGVFSSTGEWATLL
jgi:hypothetical protein